MRAGFGDEVGRALPVPRRAKAPVATWFVVVTSEAGL
jgi:hypothetical protein